MTLWQTLERAAAAGRGGIVCVRPDGSELRRSYPELLDEARRIAGGLVAAGLVPGDTLLLQLERAEDFIPGFWGCVAAGLVPAPVAVAPTYAQPNSALQKLLNAGRLVEGAPVLAAGAAVAGLRKLPAAVGVLSGAVLDIDDLRRAAPLAALPARAATDAAVLLLTSGSTGQPKGVPLTHRNLLAMSAGTAAAGEFTEAEVTLNWMALDHVGAVSFLGTMAVDLGCTQVHVPTGYILQDPLRWLELIHRHRATISWAPNFAFTLFLEREAAVRAGSWDLRCMRFLVNAGEAVVARTARRFVSLLQPHGLPADALRPAFGMSETCSGITWSRGFTLENSTDEQAFVDLGPCIAGSEMRVVDDRGELVEEGQTGLLQMRGVSVFSGYFRNPEENARVFSDDGWFTTGDLAFIRDGCLTISGRQKDVIIVNGANFYCHEVETVAESTPGVRKTYTAACAVRDSGSETDQLALFFCVEDEAAIEATARAVRAKLIQEAGVPPAYLVVLRPAEIPKTEIGKIQRGQLKKAFEAGAFRERIVVLNRKATARAPKRGRTRAELAPAIADIWAEVLALETVGYDETFFELGGHSLLVVQVQKRLEELIGRPVTVVELFECPTVRTMAAHFAKEFEPERGHLGQNAERPRAEAAMPPGGAGSREIAIIGIGLRFPGASSPAEFWQVLAEGKETIRFFTAEDALKAGVDPELVRNPNHVKAAPMLEAPEAFDAEFFKYTAKEARLIDPQQRVFLEVCWEAFEDAGYDPLSFPGRVGLFAAAGMNTYLANNVLANSEYLQEENGGRMLTVDSMSGFNVMITNDKDYLPTRVSYKLNLRGPSLNIQTACSSTLVTLHEACNSLLVGDCEMALAGGVSIKLPQHAGHLYSAGMLNSPDGHCRAYDEKAEGTIFGNGAGVVLLKPLAAALADGDRVYAVVKGTATNNDGGGKVGFTAPSATGEEEVCAQALARAGFSADTVTFMEGHGTGTPLGDPIEVNALSAAFRRDTGRTGYCALGSVKTNVGHLQIASGIAGLIKTTLALHHKAIPGTLHFEKPNPRIDFSRTPFYVTRETRAWEVAGHPRRAGVNSLGIGGSNVHAILEEAPTAEAVAPGAGLAAGAALTAPEVLPLSARHPRALRQLAERYAELLEGSTAAALEDVAYTAQVGRAALPLRAAFVGDTPKALAAQLRAFAEQGNALPAIDFEKHGLAFFYSGETGGLPLAARALYEREPAFRAALERCARILDTELGVPFLRALWGDAAERRPSDAVEFGHAATCAYQYALGELLASYGVDPTYVTGHGVGEYAAACRAGVFALEDGLRLAVARGKLAAAPLEAAAFKAFSAVAEGIEYGVAGVTLDSEGDPSTAEYWVRQAQSPAVARKPAARVTVELGLRSAGDEAMIFAGELAATLGTLFAQGYPVRWATGRRLRPARRVTLPTYPWQHQAYWIEGTDFSRPKVVRAEAADPLLGRCWRSPRVREIVYETTFDVATLPYLAEHQVHGRVVTPGALYLSQVARQAGHLLGGTAALRDVLFVRAMVFEAGQSRTVQTVFVPEGGGHRFEVLSWGIDSPDTVVVHATGAVAAATAAEADGAAALVPEGGARDVAGHYAVMDAMAVRLGPSFRWIREIRVGAGEAWVRLDAPAGLEGTRDWHPGLVDSLLQAAVPAAGLDGGRTLIPFRIERVVFHADPTGGVLFSQARRSEVAGEGVRTDVQVRDARGRLMVEVSGFELRSLQPADVQAATRALGEPELFETTWEPLTAPVVNSEAGAWLLLAGGREAEAMRGALEQAGAQVVTVAVAEAARAEALLRERSWRGVVQAWNFAVETPAAIAWRELLGSVRAAAARSDAPRYVVVTAAGSLAQTPLAGFAVGLAHEFTEWQPVQVEVAAGAADFGRCLPWLLDGASGEGRLAVREGVVLGARLVERRVATAAAPVRADASYLITGGAGALGQAVAEWLVAKGARSLVLTGRRAAPDDLHARIALWQSGGVEVVYEIADIGAAGSAQHLVAKAEALAPLRGVFHAAGSLRDGLLRTAEAETFVAPFDAKIDGAWALHLATHERKLDCFVLFSSIASLLGSPAQANYAAGNAFLDALALHRQRIGLPGLSLQWGPWDGIGMSARLQERDRQRLLERGLMPMAPAAALRALDAVWGSEGCVGIFAWDRERYRRSLGNAVPALYRSLFKVEAKATATSGARGVSLAALPLAERTEAVEWLIRETVATLLGLESSRLVEREKSLFDLGLDSLTSVDLKDRLEKAFGQTLRTTVAFDYPTVTSMAAYLAVALFPQSPAATPVAAAKPTPAAPDDLDNLSASDLEALLAEELKG